ncbi:MAG: hypothetical protein GY899_13625 [Verrucomicrobiaceae bacterium]|nr:hypothetical protein [Verrucomicrobiaceae bacterium]
MKTTLKKLTAGAIALAMLAPAALAEPGDGGKGKQKGKPGAERPGGKRPGGPGGQRPDRKSILEKFDADKDGKLSADERVSMIKDRLANNERFAAMFNKRADSDKDGKVSDEELKAAIAKMGQGRPGGRPGGDGKKPGGKPSGDGKKPGGKPSGDGKKPGGKKRPNADR